MRHNASSGAFSERDFKKSAMSTIHLPLTRFELVSQASEAYVLSIELQGHMRGKEACAVYV